MYFMQQLFKKTSPVAGFLFYSLRRDRIVVTERKRVTCVTQYL